MKTYHLFIVAFAGLFGACATTAPSELVNAREAYQNASAGVAAQVAPAELHVAGQALVRAEESFKKNPDSYKTRDLAYVAQRKAEMADATASIAIEQESQARADRSFSDVQGDIVDRTRKNLNQARGELTDSQRRHAANEQDMRQVRSDLADSKRSGDQAEKNLDQARVALAESERIEELTAVRLSAEQEARVAAEQRAAVAQAALAKLAAVKDEPRGTVITLSGSVLFGSNRSVLLPNARASLDRVADVLLTTRERNITIEGHTDSRGSDDYNVDLSQKRADSVRAFLIQRGYEADRIKAHGLGEGHPVADNTNAEGRANNRRVEIIIDNEGYTSSR